MTDVSSKNIRHNKPLVELEFLSPEYSYFPLNSKKIDFYIDNKVNIFKEQLLYKDGTKSVFSTISGKALGTKLIDKKNYLVLQNDFREKYEKTKSFRKKINNLQKKEIIDILNDNEASLYSSNINYFINNYESIDSLVLSLLVCEEPEEVYSEVFYKHNSEILEMFDGLSHIFDIQNRIILLSDTDDKNIEYVTNLSGMYPDLKIVLSHDKYPASHPLLITRKLGLNNALVLTSMDLYYLYSLIKRNKKVFEKDVLITGCDLDKDYLVHTKLNVLISDLLNACNINISKDDALCKNSFIRATDLSLSDIIDTTVDAIAIAKKGINDKKECINCGLCNKNCPQKINPQIYKLLNKPFPGKCIDCNMCSYVCPMKIGRGR